MSHQLLGGLGALYQKYKQLTVKSVIKSIGLRNNGVSNQQPGMYL